MMAPNEQNEVSKRIIIQVGGPCHKVRHATVVQSQKVLSLVKLFKENIELLFMGEVLMPNRTFAFYGVEEGSFITVVPKAESGHNNINTWQAVTRDSDFFNSMIGFASNAQTAEELARLKDIRMMRLMAKNERQTTNTLALQNNIDSWRRTVTTSTIIGKAPHAPSCEPLPYTW